MAKRYRALTISGTKYDDPMQRHITEEMVRLSIPSFAEKIHERWMNVTMFDEDPFWQFVVCYEEADNG